MLPRSPDAMRIRLDQIPGQSVAATRSSASIAELANRYQSGQAQLRKAGIRRAQRSKILLGDRKIVAFVAVRAGAATKHSSHFRCLVPLLKKIWESVVR